MLRSRTLEPLKGLPWEVTSIVFFRKIACEPEAIRLQLESTFTELQKELDMLDTLPSALGKWWVKCFEDEENKYPQGEGPHHFLIDLYEHVVVLSCGQRFHRLYSGSSMIALPLRKVICGVAMDLGEPGQQMVVGSGGFGKTDHAGDVALYQGSMDDVIHTMYEAAGTPAKSWQELDSGDFDWYLGSVTAQ